MPADDPPRAPTKGVHCRCRLRNNSCAPAKARIPPRRTFHWQVIVLLRIMNTEVVGHNVEEWHQRHFDLRICIIFADLEHRAIAPFSERRMKRGIFE